PLTIKRVCRVHLHDEFSRGSSRVGGLKREIKFLFVNDREIVRKKISGPVQGKQVFKRQGVVVFVELWNGIVRIDLNGESISASREDIFIPNSYCECIAVQHRGKQRVISYGTFVRKGPRDPNPKRIVDRGAIVGDDEAQRK